MTSTPTSSNHNADTHSVGDATYEATIRRTTHGVAHISANSWANLGFGQGFACASDHLATICDQVTKASGQRSSYLGPGPANEHLFSDLGYAALGTRTAGEAMAETQPEVIQQLVRGYAAGCNAWLDQTGREALPAWCRDAAWIHELTPADLYTMYADMALMASGRNLASWIGSAVPPGHQPAQASRQWSDRPPTPGSNGWAIGRDQTAHRGGLVMANPHFPWNGDGRFWECHLTIPGTIDVYGGSLIGTPGVQIGFNSNVAWTHTFSRGHRFVLYRLTLGSTPTTYMYGHDALEMDAVQHRIDVLGDDGVVTTQSFTRWTSHYGPIVDVPLLGWSGTDAYAIKDANAGNDRMLAQFLAFDQASSVDEIRSSVHQIDGLPWVNIMAADAAGDVYYADPSTTPNLPDDADQRFAEAVVNDPITALFHSMRVALLDGSDPYNEWVDHPDGTIDGLRPSTALPELLTTSSVFNANDSYWVAQPDSLLPRNSALCGLAGIAQSPRTRMNASVLASVPAGGWTASAAMDRLFDNRSFTADALADAVVARLGAFIETSGPTCIADGRQVDLSEAFDVLSKWDRTYDIESVGAIVWREFIGSFPAAEVSNGGSLWAIPFDADDPLGTPSGLASGQSPEQADTIVINIARAVLALNAADIAVSTPLGEAQFAQRGAHRIGVHGGADVEGLLNIVTPVANLTNSTLEPTAPASNPIPGRTEATGLSLGGYQCVYGASLIMAVELGPDGPSAEGLLVYGQSGDPDSPHHIDQFNAFSSKTVRPMLFNEADIAADPNLTTVTVRS